MITSEPTIALQTVFTNLSTLLGTELTLNEIVSADEEGVTLYLSRDIYIGCGDYETHTHAVTFTWDELVAGDNLHEVALGRWTEAQEAATAEAKRISREKEKREAAEAKRTRAASKGARTKRELATLKRLLAKHGTPT